MRRLTCRQARLWGRYAPALVAFWTIAAHAASANFGAVLGGSGQDYGSAVASDAAGNTYVAGLTYSPDFPVTAGAFQTKLAGNGSLANPFAIASDAFVAKFAPDGTLLWSTFLGGSGDDYATGVGVDAAGNVLVTGWTRSVDFPVLHALQPLHNGGVSPYRWDAFVSKLDPTGSKLLYSTYLGGVDDDGAYGLAVDSAGNAYITGSVGDAAGFPGFAGSPSGFGVFVSKLDPQGALVYSFFHLHGSFAEGYATAAIAVDATGSAYVTGTADTSYPVTAAYSFGPSGSTQAMVFKLAPDGSRIIYETTLGGSVDSSGMAVAVDSSGAAYVGGITNSVDFPMVHPLQSDMGARPLWTSSDGGVTWTTRDKLPFAFLQALAVDPGSPATLYAATSDAGVLKSTDGGVTWNPARHGLGTNHLQALAIDPLHPQTLYTATVSGPRAPGIVIYKTVDGGNNWMVADSSAAVGTVQLAIDPQNPNNVFWDDGGAITRKSTDAGATWNDVSFPGTAIQSLALDPHVSGGIYAYSVPIIRKPPQPSIPAFVWRSTDGGATWVQLSSPPPGQPPVWTIDGSTNPSTVYNGLNYRSTDNGATWTSLPASPVSGGNTTAIAVDPGGKLYVAVYNNVVFVSRDHGQSWAAAGTPVPPTTDSGLLPSVAAIVPAGATGTLYAVVPNQQTSGFVAKLTPDGSNIVYSTLLNGHVSMAPWTIYAAEPGVFLTQNWISGIALDSGGNVVVAGGTRASDLPTANPRQAANAGRADAFVATLAADGSKLTYSTYFGGSRDDAALAVTVDSQGDLVFAGQTWSLDFPVADGVPPRLSGYGKAFVVKSPPAYAPAITSVLNGASFQAGIEAGSWVMIKGSNLANTTRTWRGSDIVNGSLPASLDGVSVTIGGKPAFVEYISPTQINVQAPDAVVGAVTVVVDNNGAASAPATAQLQAAAPAFFMYPGTTTVIASRLPDYSLLSGVVAALPGDMVALWGTGFGGTTPDVAAGTVVAGAPAAAVTLPTVTVGGVPAQVMNTVLAPGSAGLYQIAIQLPASLPSGALPVVASMGGAQTQAGVTIFVGKP
jgi:uncharacterized protein (TIGR03437 family)